jgi:predicted ATPase
MSKAGDVLICENPESHLHPEAQSRLGMFLARVADAGIQVILETHSDHILNGIRVAVKKGIINNIDVAINSFDRDHVVSHPKIDKNGRIDLWPEGFFDQIDMDLGELI